MRLLTLILTLLLCGRAIASDPNTLVVKPVAVDPNRLVIQHANRAKAAAKIKVVSKTTIDRVDRRYHAKQQNQINRDRLKEIHVRRAIKLRNLRNSRGSRARRWGYGRERWNGRRYHNRSSRVRQYYFFGITYSTRQDMDR